MNPTRPHDDRVLPETRWTALAVFLILVPAAAILWVEPDRTADLWAWPVRLIVQTFLVATALLLIGAIHAFADFDTRNPLTWLYLGGLTGTAGALVLLIRSTERNGVGPIHPGGSRWPSPVS